MIEFFFSSRRRYTRLQGDWSSDVCSSDLVDVCSGHDREPAMIRRIIILSVCFLIGAGVIARASRRSEERRVGKERRKWEGYDTVYKLEDRMDNNILSKLK